MFGVAEVFMINVYVWLFAFLLLGVLISVVILLFRRGVGGDGRPLIGEGRSSAKSRPHRKEAARKAGLKARGGFSEKVGEKVVKYMVEVAASGDRKLVQDRIRKIQQECAALSQRPLPEENKRIISTVSIWAKKFDPDKHVGEMSLYHRSSQIVYDPKKRDFQLLIVEEK